MTMRHASYWNDAGDDGVCGTVIHMAFTKQNLFAVQKRLRQE
jgi:hypothetical protein